MRNKKASTVPPVKAIKDLKNNINNNIISENKKKYTTENKENKVLKNKHNDTVNNTFTEYDDKELENRLRESQSKRLGYQQFNPNYEI
jgi:hypothetical protein